MKRAGRAVCVCHFLPPIAFLMTLLSPLSFVLYKWRLLQANIPCLPFLLNCALPPEPPNPHPHPSKMAFGNQTPQESNARGRVKCTPLQGAEYAAKHAGGSSTPGCGDLEEWFRRVSTVHLFRRVPLHFAMLDDIRLW